MLQKLTFGSSFCEGNHTYIGSLDLKSTLCYHLVEVPNYTCSHNCKNNYTRVGGGGGGGEVVKCNIGWDLEKDYCFVNLDM